MAFTDKSPEAWLGDGYSSSAGKIELTTNDAVSSVLLPELTDAEADPVTGDIRKLVFGLLEGLYKKLKEKNDSLDIAERPVNFLSSRSAVVGENGEITQSYSFSFKLTASSIEVSDEPY